MNGDGLTLEVNLFLASEVSQKKSHFQGGYMLLLYNMKEEKL